jgi:hypothetical protein
MDDLGRTLIVVGGVILVVGVLLSVAGDVPLLGKLPGDFTLRGDGWTVYAPIATMLIVSVALTALLSLVSWLQHR